MTHSLTQPLLEEIVSQFESIEEINKMLNAVVGPDGPIPDEIKCELRNKLSTIESLIEFNYWCGEFIRRQKGVDTFILNIIQDRIQNPLQRLSILDLLLNQYNHTAPQRQVGINITLNKLIEFIGYKIPALSNENIHVPLDTLALFLRASKSLVPISALFYKLGLIEKLTIKAQETTLSLDEFLFYTAFASAKDIIALPNRTLTTITQAITQHPGQREGSQPKDRYQYLLLKHSMAKINLLKSDADNNLSVELSRLLNQETCSQLARHNTAPYALLPIDYLDGPLLDITNLNLARAQWNGLYLARAKIINANLIASQLSNSQLPQSMLNNVSLSDSLINESNLSSSHIKNVDFTRSSLISTSMRKAFFSGRVRFNHAILEETIFSNAYCTPNSEIDFGDARLNRANLDQTCFSKVNETTPEGNQINFSRANLEQASLTHVWLEGKNAKMEYARLIGVDASDAHLKYANLKYADMRGINLSRADLSGTDLSGAILIGANLTHVRLNNTKLTGAKFLDLSPITLVQPTPAHIELVNHLTNELDRLMDTYSREQLEVISLIVAQQIIETVMKRDDWDNESKSDYLQRALLHPVFKHQSIMNLFYSNAVRMLGFLSDQNGLSASQECIKSALDELNSNYQLTLVEPVY
ncbi:pentapeptide repeat-containing protein [Legionella sp. WA2022007384]